MNTIYQVPGYALTVAGDDGILSNGSRQQRIPLRHGTDEIPAALAAALKKAGQNPGDYFCVAGKHVLRRAALSAWTVAVEARIAERHAEKAAADAALAAEIASTGKRALVLHDAYLVKSSLVFVRPLRADERARLVPEFAAHAVRVLGERTTIRREIADRFLAGRGRPDGWLDYGESAVYLVTDAEWDALVAGDLAALETERAEKRAAEQAESARIETARAKAEKTGDPVEVDRIMDECDGTEKDCSFDLIRRMIRADGTRFVIRSHCH